MSSVFDYARFLRKWLLVLPAILLLAGCASVPYNYSRSAERPASLELREGEQQIETGRRCVPVDVIGNIYSIGVKVLLLDWRMGNHNVSSNTVKVLDQYLADNELSRVKVRVNQYAPGGEWSRLFRNKSVGAGWRYTIGLFSVITYTVLPGRVFGGDNYNPYTDTVNLYSDLPAVALHEAGHAKDSAKRTYRGSYSAMRMLPLVSLYQESVATGDAIGYAREKGLTSTEKTGYEVLYPAFCTYIAGEAGTFYQGPYGFLVQVSALIPGHIVGRIKGAMVKETGEKSVTVPAPSDKLPEK